MKQIIHQSIGFLRVVSKLSLSSYLLLASLGTAHAQSTVHIDGSSTVYPITEAVAEDFQAAEKNKTNVVVGISGTGGGFKKFCRGEIDVVNASRPILTKEMDECRKANIKYIELPIAFDALVVVVQKNNSFINDISVEELKKIWAPESKGAVMKWSDVRAGLPTTPLKLYGAGTDSGTFDYFTEAIVGKAKSSRSDYTASEDDNVLVQGVSKDKGGLAYFGFAYYIENQSKLKALGIKANATAKAVLPSEQTVTDASYQPLSRPLFIYVSADAVKKPEVDRFVQFYLKNAAKLTREVKYFPLKKEDYEHASRNYTSRKVGTAFGGEPKIGVKVSDLLKMDPKQ
jgi:phosphate transport system substrate-binding protein